VRGEKSGKRAGNPDPARSEIRQRVSEEDISRAKRALGLRGVESASRGGFVSKIRFVRERF
jgi:hypothetical protein